MNMKLSTIPCTLRNGRVQAVAREYWRLVLPGEVLTAEDQFYRFDSWVNQIWHGGEVFTQTGDEAFDIHRRRVTVKGGAK